MPRKSAMRDYVSAVRSRLPHLSSLPREKIELALLYYESNVDETVEAFKRDGAIEALGGWTEMTSDRGNGSTKRTSNKSVNRNSKTSSSPILPSNGVLRPSQRVSNIFQTFAEGGVPAITPHGHVTLSNTITSSPSSTASYAEQTTSDLQPYPSDDHSFHTYLSQDSPAANPASSIHVTESMHNESHDTSYVTTNSSTTGDEMNLLTNHIDPDDSINGKATNHEFTNGHHGKGRRRKAPRNRNGSTSSSTLTFEQKQPAANMDVQAHHASPPATSIATATVTKPSSSNSPIFSDNRKILTKSAKDLQRQTSTLSNVEASFESEMKSSIKRIDDTFKQIREIINDREIQLYLEMDKVKEHGLSVIHRRQHRATELRQRMDRCDRLEPTEIDHLRTDVKQFVTDRRYDLGEELTSAHRFEYDATLIEALKQFGTVLRIDRANDRARTVSTSSALVETNGAAVDKAIVEKSPEVNSAPMTNGRATSSPVVSPANHHPLPQRTNHKQNFNGHTNTDQHAYPAAQVNGYCEYYEEPNSYQTINRRRPPAQQYAQYPNENARRPRPMPTANSNRRNGVNNSETTNTYRRPRPPQSIVPPVAPIGH